MELVLMKDGVWSNYSDLTRPGPPNGGLVREIPENFREIDRLVKYYSIWPDGVSKRRRVFFGRKISGEEIKSQPP